jgi:hypothetical protein
LELMAKVSSDESAPSSTGIPPSSSLQPSSRAEIQYSSRGNIKSTLLI